MILGRDLSCTIAAYAKNRECIIITDSNLAPTYGRKLKTLLQRASEKVHLLSFQAGEKSKTKETKEFLEDEMFRLGVNRKTLIVALGGGVVTDLVGFLAATYMRGLDFISVPTTLMGMVDASIGGKTGINTRYGKNLIGAFYEPQEIFIDFSYLDTLPQKEMKEGLVEVLKYGLILDCKLFSSVQSFKPDRLEEIVKRSSLIKMEIVKKDKKEKGLRQILNFGHTIGHSLELLSNYTLSHGHAVFLGLLLESRISVEMGLLSENEMKKILNLQSFFDFSFPHFTCDEIYKASCMDKKNVGKKPHFVLIKSIGEVYNYKRSYSHVVDLNVFKESYNYVTNHFFVA